MAEKEALRLANPDGAERLQAEAFPARILEEIV
jgi:hypothetical protein